VGARATGISTKEGLREFEGSKRRETLGKLHRKMGNEMLY